MRHCPCTERQAIACPGKTRHPPGEGSSSRNHCRAPAAPRCRCPSQTSTLCLQGAGRWQRAEQSRGHYTPHHGVCGEAGSMHQHRSNLGQAAHGCAIPLPPSKPCAAASHPMPLPAKPRPPWLPPQPQVHSRPPVVTAAECFHPAATCFASRQGMRVGHLGVWSFSCPCPSTPFCSVGRRGRWWQQAGSTASPTVLRTPDKCPHVTPACLPAHMIRASRQHRSGAQQRSSTGQRRAAVPTHLTAQQPSPT